MTCQTCMAYEAVVADLSTKLTTARMVIEAANRDDVEPAPGYELHFDPEFGDWSFKKSDLHGVLSCPGYGTRAEAALGSWLWDKTMADVLAAREKGERCPHDHETT